MHCIVITFADRVFSCVYLADGQEGQPEQRVPHRLWGLAAQTAEGKADAERDGRVRTREVSASRKNPCQCVSVSV